MSEPRVIATGPLEVALALAAGVAAFARRSAVPVRLDVNVDGRLPEPIELVAYYVVAEALTSTAKQAAVSVVDVQAESRDGVLHVRVRDDGRGGADVAGGSGLVGLTDRMEALGGRLSITSPLAAGTTLAIELPITAVGRVSKPAWQHRRMSSAADRDPLWVVEKLLLPGVPDSLVARRSSRRSPHMTTAAEHDHHESADHPHVHGEGCGHESVQHGDHVDYVHDGHRHASHEGHYDEHGDSE